MVCHARFETAERQRAGIQEATKNGNKGICSLDGANHIAKGKKVREKVPVIQDLLFVYDSRRHLDSIVEKTRTLQYRWLRNTFREPMTVPDLEMDRFIQAVSSTDSPKYYLPEEITSQMCGRKIRIIGGPLNGYEGCLLKIRGSKIKRLLVELKGYLAVGVEVLPEYIQFV